MKIFKHLFTSTSLCLLVFWLILGCKKDNTSPEYCNDGTCCDITMEKFIVAGHVEGERVWITGDANIPSIREVHLNRGYGGICASGTANVCLLTVEKVKNVKLSLDYIKPEYYYKVWGTVYYRDVMTNTCMPVLSIRIDRVEAVN